MQIDDRHLTLQNFHSFVFPSSSSDFVSETKNNPVLIGDPLVGEMAIAEGYQNCF